MQVTHTTELSKLQGKSAALETEEVGKLNLEVEKLKKKARKLEAANSVKEKETSRKSV